MDELCIGALCIDALYIGALCVGSLCIGALCVGALCIGALCIGALCVGTPAGGVLIAGFRNKPVGAIVIGSGFASKFPVGAGVRVRATTGAAGVGVGRLGGAAGLAIVGVGAFAIGGVGALGVGALGVGAFATGGGVGTFAIGGVGTFVIGGVGTLAIGGGVAARAVNVFGRGAPAGIGTLGFAPPSAGFATICDPRAGDGGGFAAIGARGGGVATGAATGAGADSAPGVINRSSARSRSSSDEAGPFPPDDFGSATRELHCRSMLGIVAM